MLTRLDGDESLLMALAEPWTGQVGELLATARKGIEEGDAESVRRAAHTLKGAAGVFSASIVVERALRLEKAAAEGAVPDDAETLLADLAAACDGLTWALERLQEGG